MDIQTQDTNTADLLARIAALEAQNAALRKVGQGKVSLKVTDKGAVSMYGLGRFPVTLYLSQWERLLGAKDAVEAFVATNRHLLSVKE